MLTPDISIFYQIKRRIVYLSSKSAGMNLGKTNLLAGLAMFLLSNYTGAQDGHYWSENYGNKSMLLSGTVNASVDDLGAVFYNPGRLGQIKNPVFAISGKVYEYNLVKIENGINEGTDLTNSDLGGAPSLVAGTFKIPFLKKHKFAYSFLTRQRAKLEFSIREEREGDVIDAIPGNEIFNGQLKLTNNTKDEWFGLTWSIPINEKLSLGASGFISSLNKSSAFTIDMNALGEDNHVASLYLNRQYGYNSEGLIWKVGAAWDLHPIHLGLTVTTPKVNLIGDGSSLYEDYMVGIDTTGDGNNDDVYVFNYQDYLDTEYSTPWAIGFGAGFHFNKGIIHLSAEWYDNIPHYSILEAEPFVGQSTGDTIRFSLNEQLNPVLNWGVGLELKCSDKLSIYTSFATDNSGVTSNITRYIELEEEASNSVFQADFFRIGCGFSLYTKWAEIALGATYNRGTQQFDRPINFPEEGGDSIFESGQKSAFRFTQWRFILGFSFTFADKMKKTFEMDKFQ